MVNMFRPRSDISEGGRSSRLRNPEFAAKHKVRFLTKHKMRFRSKIKVRFLYFRTFSTAHIFLRYYHSVIFDFFNFFNLSISFAAKTLCLCLCLFNSFVFDSNGVQYLSKSYSVFVKNIIQYLSQLWRGMALVSVSCLPDCTLSHSHPISKLPEWQSQNTSDSEFYGTMKNFKSQLSGKKYLSHWMYLQHNSKYCKTNTALDI